MRKIVVLLLLGLISIGVFAEGKKILVIESYHEGFKWDADYRAGLEAVIPKGNTIVYFEMDTKRVPVEEHQKMADKAYQKYLEIKPDVVVVGDDAALKMAGPKLAATKTPIVYLGINNNPRNYFTELPLNMTGVLERPILKRGVTYVRDIIPGVKKGLLMFDSNLTSQIIKKEYFEDKGQINISGIDTSIVLIDSYSEWKETVEKSKGKYDFIIVGLYQTIKDETGKTVNMDDVIRWTSANAPVPVFGFWDFSVDKDKTIGGYVLAGRDMGERAGKMVADILKGVDIKTIRPIFESDGIFVYSKAQLNKWKVKLPEDIAKKAELIE